jgi:squalene-associated FAD-dependent desaturase
LLEKRPVLGGRASSFLPPGGSEPIDNCQHVLLGCCTNLIDFFRRAGAAGSFRFYNRFLFLGPEGLSSVGSSSLPAPFHLLPSFASFRDLDWSDRLAVARAMFAILRQGGDDTADELMSDWLRRQRQTPRAIEHFWRAILTSALNEDLERMSTRHAFKVFWESFLRNRRGYRMGVPTASLSELYSGDNLKQKCRITQGAAVARIEVEGLKIARVILQTGEALQADYYVTAVPPGALAKSLPPQLLIDWPALEQLAQLEWSPITGIHLWFDRPISELEHAAIVGRTVQWLFNKDAIARLQSPQSGRRDRSEVGAKSATGHYVQFVVSASRGLTSLRRDEIIMKVLEEIRELFPASREARLLKSVVVRENESTISFPPGTDSLRPGPESPLANLFLAGDWTATGWPPTMEGAVRSGYRAAESVTAAAGNAQQFLVPDLPTGLLPRLLCRSGKA